jgi:hypothetical protein
MTLLLIAFAATVVLVSSRRAVPIHRVVTIGMLTLLGAPCAAQLVWARRDPDMAQTKQFAAGSYGSAYDASRGRHVLFLGESDILIGSQERVFAFDGENWTTTTVPTTVRLGDGSSITEDPTGRGRIVRVEGLTNSRTSRWDPNTRDITTLTTLDGPFRGFGALRYVPGIGAVLFGGWFFGGLADDHTWIWDGAVWRDATSGARPSQRYGAAASRGNAAQPLVLFGGHGSVSRLNDTWSFDGTSWTQQVPATAPSPRSTHQMAYDPVRNRVVMFGGYQDVGGYARDTWEWDGVDWHAITPPHSPPAGAPISMNWDPLRRRVVLAGINTSGNNAFLPNLPIDTWEWDGADWTQLNANPTGARVVVPPARAYHALGYDSQRRRVVAFGGSTGFLLGTRLADTWDSDSRLWQQRATTGNSPPAASPNAGAALRSNGTLCYVPGRATPLSTYNELWRWNGVDWSVSPLSAATIVPQHQVLGSLQSSQLGWVLVRLVTSTTWTNDLQIIVPSNGLVQPMFPAGGPSPRVGSVMVQPASAAIAPNKVWLFGGNDGTANRSDLWELADTGTAGNLAWTNVPPAGGSQSPAGRRDAAAAYHDGLNRLFVMGGLSQAGVPLGDTWMFDFTTRVWTPLGNGPAPRYGAAMTYDASIGRLVLTGGYDGTTVFDDIWESDGTNWTQRTTAGRPSPRHNHTFVYDRTSRRAVLFGGHDGQGSVNETWIHDGAQWTPIVDGVASPSPRFTHTACFVEQGSSMVVFGGTTDGIGELGDTWRLDQAGRWTPGAAGPPPRVNPAMVYAIVQGEPCCLLFGGYRQGAPLGDTWRYLPATDTWQQLAGGPPARDIHAMAWDRLRNVVVLFGGRSTSSFFADDTWEFNCATATWSQRTPANVPPARWNGTMDFDQSRGRTVLFGGYAGSYLNDIWEWNGSDWEQRVAETDAPGGREDAAMCYDADRGRMQMMGGWTGSARTNDLWFLSARIDRAGAGNTVRPEELRYYSQPALGGTLRLGFTNPQGLGLLALGFGPLQQPLGQLGGPLCEVSNMWALAVFIAVTGTVEPNFGVNIPNSSSLSGASLVFQGFANQPTNCFRATDALHVRL